MWISEQATSSPCLWCASIHALIPFDNTNVVTAHQIPETWFIPRYGHIGMLKEKMSTDLLLFSQRDSKPEMFESFAPHPIIVMPIELRVVLILVHEGEARAWRR